MRPDEFSERFAVPFVPAAQLLADHRCVVSGMILKCEDQIAVHIGKIRHEPNAFPVRINCFGEPPRVHEGVAEIHVCFGISRSEPDGLAIRSHRLIQLADFSQGIAEVIVRIGIVRLELNDPPDQFHGRIRPADLPRQHAEHIQGLKMVRLPLQDLAIDFLRFPHATRPVVPKCDLKRFVDRHSALFSLNLAVQT